MRVGVCAILGLFALAAASPALADQPPPRVLQPSSQWLADYGETLCSLRRTFGTGDAMVRLELQRHEPTLEFDLVIAGEQFAKRRAEYDVAISFGPDDFGTFLASAVTAETWAGLPVLHVRNIGVQASWFRPEPEQVALADQSGTKASTSKGDPVRAPLRLLASVPKEAVDDAEKRATRLTIIQKGGAAVTLETGSMAAPMRIMRHCIDTLLESWGIDPAVQASLSVGAQPLGSPAGWLSSNDYPTAMLLAEQGANLRFVLLVGADGKVRDCKVVSGPGTIEFRKATCKSLSRRAKFTPARNAQGEPTQSYYTNTARWIIPSG